MFRLKKVDQKYTIFVCSFCFLEFVISLIFCPILNIDSFADVSTNELQLHVFREGKADAFLLYSDEHAVMIDAGLAEFGKDILKYLEKRNISSIDLMIITHFDQDHVGGASKVLENVSVKRVLQSNCPKESAEYSAYLAALAINSIEAETIREKTVLQFDDVEYTIYPPKRSNYNSDPSNNSSLAVGVCYGDTSFFFSGDAEGARINELCAIGIGEYDVLQVPHHGKWCRELESLIETVKPKVAFITSSDSEKEDSDTMQLLEQQGISVYLSRKTKINIHSNGAVIFVNN